MMSDDTDPTLMRPPRSRGSSKGEAEKNVAPEDQALSPALARFGHACFVALDSVLWRHQLSMLEWQALAAILTLGEPTISQISRRVYRSPSQTTVLMNRLAGRGWVRELGERPSKFALTDKSLDVLPYPSALSSALEQRVNHALTEDQQALLAQLLWKVLSA